jgi:predicted acylesterase/phospholipase RssA
VAAGSLGSNAFRARDAREVDAATKRPSLRDVARGWLEARRSELKPTERYPIIIVAAAGGGIRAAYWAAGLLAALQDREPGFSRHVFGISGVSGGSVGAAVYASLVKAKCTACQEKAATILGGDFLAPTLGAMLIRDVTSATFGASWPDRGATLEEAFERSWRKTVGTNQLGERLEDLWSADDAVYVPQLFLNTTRAGRSERVVVSGVSMQDVATLDTQNQHDIEARGFRLSTAAVLSARFPYVSPEARIASNDRVFRLVDGGFFDNSGAATAIDILDALDREAAALGLRDRVRHVVLLIENAPPKPESCALQNEQGGAGTPLSTLDSLRAAQSERFVALLRAKVKERGGLVLDDFRPRSGPAEFPLGWTLSQETRSEMDRQIAGRMRETKGDVAELLRLVAQ